MEESYPEAEDIFGPITERSIHLKVQGTLKVMRLLLDQEKQDWRVCIPASTKLCGVSSENLGWRKVAKAYLDFDLDVSNRSLIEKSCYYYMPWKWGPSFFHCLLLELVSEDLGRFRRLGILFTREGRDIQLLQESQGNERSLPCCNFNETNGAHYLYSLIRMKLHKCSFGEAEQNVPKEEER